MNTPNDIPKKIIVEVMALAIARMAANQITPAFEQWAEEQS